MRQKDRERERVNHPQHHSHNKWISQDYFLQGLVAWVSVDVMPNYIQ